MPAKLQACIARLEQCVCLHEHFREAYDEVLDLVSCGIRPALALVVGPTGAGKSHLMRSLDQAIRDGLKKLPSGAAGYPLLVEASPPPAGDFDWRTFYLDLLQELNDPAPTKKVSLSKLRPNLGGASMSATRSKPSMPELMASVKKGIIHHNPTAILVDEAQHFGKARTELRRLTNLDVIKNLAQKTASVWVLFGTYEVRDMLYRGGQLSRRLHIIHMPRYAKTPHDVGCLIGALQAVIEETKIPVRDSFLTDAEYIYDHTLGTVGIGVDWLKRALARAKRNRSPRISRDIFEKTRPTNQQLTEILRENRAFEKLHEDTGDFDYDAMMSLEEDCGELPYAGASIISAERARKGRRTVGVRRPKRDPVKNR